MADNTISYHVPSVGRVGEDEQFVLEGDTYSAGSLRHPAVRTLVGGVPDPAYAPPPAGHSTRGVSAPTPLHATHPWQPFQPH